MNRRHRYVSHRRVSRYCVEPPPTNAGLTARGQTYKEAGYANEYLRSPRLSEMAAGALPGVAGMLT